MKILYVVSRAIEINTSASIRNYATIKGLVENGHQVTLVSVEPDKKHPAYDNNLRLESVEKIYFKLSGVQSVYKFGRGSRFLNKIKPYIYHILYGQDIYDNLKGIIRHVNEIIALDFDVVISSSDPKSSHLFVDCFLKNYSKKIPWIQIWGDPFADDITRSGKGNSKVEEEERRLLKLADKIVYVSKITCEHQKKKYSESRDKMVYIPIPYAQTRICAHDFPKDYRDVKICYCGDYNSRIRDIRPLYATVKKLGLQMKICGMSDLALKSDDHITVLPRQNAKIVKEIEDNSDILIHLSNKSGTQIPGKIYQYIATDKTILFILDGDVETLKETFGNYNRCIFSKNTEKELEKALVNIRSLRTSISNKPVEYFSAKNISEIIIEGITEGKVLSCDDNKLTR